MAPTNASSDIINDIMLEKLEGEEVSLYSTDALKMETEKNKREQEQLLLDFPSEVLHSIDRKNIPPHKLVLKKNSLVMVTRNVNFKNRLVNGQKALVEEIHKNFIELTLLCKGRPKVAVPRITFELPAGKNGITFQRRQFPLRLCYCMTINKSQGQTLDVVGLDLRDDVFAHGQLYVALSRVRNRQHIIALLPKERICEDTGHTLNVVLRDFVEAATVGTKDHDAIQTEAAAIHTAITMSRTKAAAAATAAALASMRKATATAAAAAKAAAAPAAAAKSKVAESAAMEVAGSSRGQKRKRNGAKEEQAKGSELNNAPPKNERQTRVPRAAPAQQTQVRKRRGTSKHKISSEHRKKTALN